MWGFFSKNLKKLNNGGDFIPNKKMAKEYKTKKILK